MNIMKWGMAMAFSVGVVGAAGYAGIELVRRLTEHPDFDVKVITSDADAGCPLAEIYPAFTGVSDLVFSPHNDAQLDRCDAVFLAVPHTVALGQVPCFLKKGISVFDLSADYRLKDPALYRQWYGVEHTSPELLEQAAFGLPELARADIERVAAEYAYGRPVLVACAGCYPTATSLAAYPAVDAGMLQGVLNVQAVSGVTGAGRKPTERTSFCRANENVEAYGASGHRHTPEIEQILGLPDKVVFVPHLAPLGRGLLSTVTIQLTDQAASGFDATAAQNLYEGFYADSLFVRVLPQGRMPGTSQVVGTNTAHIGVAYREATHTLVASCALDNLCKGAAGQAVQCANIVFGLPEDAGLTSMSLPV